MTGDNTPDFEGLSCPVPLSEYPRVTLAHGGGGRLSQMLIQTMFLPQFRNPHLEVLHDGAVMPLGGQRIAVTTDSYVVSPIFFPGGTIGSLAVNGTVNDLAMCGAHPLYLTVGLIIEEGLPMEDLWRVVRSMSDAAREAGVMLVAGDTKVVDRGKGDKVFVSTAGVGVVPAGVDVNPRRAAPGDTIILSGPIAEHGIAIMSVREGLEFESPVRSDTTPLAGLVRAMLDACADIHVLRDPTRGGIASSLNEIAASSGVGVRIEEELLPVGEDVRGACEILGLDPLYVANEGKLLAFVPSGHAPAVLDAMRQRSEGMGAVIIGEAVGDHAGTVIMKSRIGGNRVVDMLAGEQLPRIC